MASDTLAITAHKASIANVMAGNKDQWLALFSEHAVVRDPAGPSEHDPEGKGSRGLAEISLFWDRMIGPGDLTIVPHKRIPCGDKIAAVVMTATNKFRGVKSYIEMVAVYEVDEAGKLIKLDVYWDVNALAQQLAK